MRASYLRSRSHKNPLSVIYIVQMYKIEKSLMNRLKQFKLLETIAMDRNVFGNGMFLNAFTLLDMHPIILVKTDVLDNPP